MIPSNPFSLSNGDNSGSSQKNKHTSKFLKGYIVILNAHHQLADTSLVPSPPYL